MFSNAVCIVTWIADLDKIFFKFIEYLFEYISTQEKENDCRMNIYNVVMKQINLGIVQKYCRTRITVP